MKARETKPAKVLGTITSHPGWEQETCPLREYIYYDIRRTPEPLKHHFPWVDLPVQ